MHLAQLRRLAPTLTIVALSIAGCHQPELDEHDSIPAPVELFVAAPSATAARAPVKRVFAPSRAGCEVVPVFAAGEPAGALCVDDASKEALTVIDLSDAWTPRVFAPDARSGRAPEYRAKYLELAGARSADLGLYGVAPHLSIAAARVSDEKRRGCNEAIDRAPLLEAGAALEDAGEDKQETAAALKLASAKPALTVIQSELACAGLLKPAQVTGRMSSTTQIALEAFRRRHMIIGTQLDAGTVRALALGGEELAFRALLRGLRERVADAGGLLEDGSASETQADVVGRTIDLARFAPSHEEAIAGGARIWSARRPIAPLASSAGPARTRRVRSWPPRTSAVCAGCASRSRCLPLPRTTARRWSCAWRSIAATCSTTLLVAPPRRARSSTRSVPRPSWSTPGTASARSR